ncbi:MAG: hypothetical protein JXA57_20530 [Armatimonadetes bacterium]|nr:hypothetical protein [Armatimonadota bacterium]
MKDDGIPVVFTPDNEPYLGRELLHALDDLICCALERNAELAPKSHEIELTDHQRMAAQVIPQTLSLGLSTRELVRQGYLFGAHVLKRALVERAVILFYLDMYPGDIDLWNRGWSHRDAPSLAKMFEAIQPKLESAPELRGCDLTAAMNSLTHGKPDSAWWNLVVAGDESVGHASSKILDRPDLCDELCADVIPWLVVVLCLMVKYFGGDPVT